MLPRVVEWKDNHARTGSTLNGMKCSGVAGNECISWCVHGAGVGLAGAGVGVVGGVGKWSERKKTLRGLTGWRD